MVPSFLWALLILLMHAIPGSEIASITFWDIFAADKYAHLAVFAVFTVVLRVGMRRQGRFPGLAHRAAWASLLIAIAYGGILEVLQGISFEDRTPDFLDFLANAIGATVGLLLFRIIYGKDLST